MAWTLCSKDDVLELVPGSRAELKDSWSEQVEHLIRQYLRQPNLGKTETVTDELISGDGSSILVPDKTPIISVTSLTVDGVLLMADEYVVFKNRIQLKYQTFTKGILNVEISYVAGDTDIDPVVTLAASTMIVAMLTYRRRSGADSSYKWGDVDQGAGDTTANVNIGLTSHLDRIMKRLLQKQRIWIG